MEKAERKIRRAKKAKAVKHVAGKAATETLFGRCDLGSEQDIKKVTRYLNKSILQIFYKYDINVPFPNVTYSVLDTDNRKTMEDLMKGKKAGDAK